MMHLYDLFTADKLLQLWSQFLHDRKKQEQALWTRGLLPRTVYNEVLRAVWSFFMIIIVDMYMYDNK